MATDPLLHLPPPVRSGRAHYRRASVRLRCEPEMARRVFIADSYHILEAQVANLSRTGIGLILESSIKTGILVFVELLQKGFAMEFLANVVHTTQLPEGGWLVGCEFLTPLSREDFRFFATEPDQLQFDE